MEKTYYDKKIVYLDYLERGEKIRNAGYVKWEVKNKECRIQIHIRGLHTTDTLQGEIILLTKEDKRAADTLQLQYGTGEYTGRWEQNNLAGTGIDYENCHGIRIKLSESRRIEAIWGETVTMMEKEAIMDLVKEEERELEPLSVVEEREEVELEATPVVEEKFEQKFEAFPVVEEREEQEPESVSVVVERDELKVTEPMVKLENVAKEVITVPNNTTEISNSRDTNSKPERLSGDKWVQLNRIYPHIRPFGDKREYLSVGPRDFVVLTRRYQNLVQNSFLLHGYYNYGHVILTRIREGEEDVYYLGVPGVYYDREKQAALMFGFEGFESGTEVAGEGGFGYYMKRVDI